MVAIIALGDNDIEMPCLLFNNEAEAQTYLEETPNVKFFGTPNNKWICDKYQLSQENSGRFFHDYYDGCGGVWAFVIREVEFGKPMGSWNLD